MSALALIWIIFAVVQDLRTREIANWLNFSLILFALAFRFLYSLFSENFSFLYQGLIGLGIFFVLGNLLYYGRMFAGGDSKLMIALGAVLPFYYDFFNNLNIFITFLVVFLFSGAVYGLVYSIVLSLTNTKAFGKEFFRQFAKKKKLFYLIMIFGLAFMSLGFWQSSILFLGVFIFASPSVYVFSKAVEEACLIKNKKTNMLTEGDWLYKDVKVGKKWIRKNWEGLTKEDIKKIRKKYKQVQVKEGIPFSPVFIISLILMIIFYFFRIDIINFF